jgi:hypothetical protein
MYKFLNPTQISRKASVAYGKADLLYRGWTVVQLFSIFYTFTSIYYFGIIGLITFPLLNTFLMASVCFYVSKRTGVNVGLLLSNLFLNKSFLVFISMVFIPILLMNYYFTPQLSNVLVISLKLISLSLIVIIAGIICYPKYLKKSFNKIF